MSDEIAISVQNLTKLYKLYNSPQDRLKEALHPFRKKYHRDFYSLDDVSFEVKKGESIGIIGKNGSGKSTLLKMITGVLTPTSGTVKVNGRISALLELGAGFNPELTGIENVYFNGTLMGFSKEEMHVKLDDILAFADIGDFVYQPVKTYSSGMFVRLAFAVAISIDPELLIVDEALAVGDINFAQKCMDYMLKFFNEKTVVLVSHNIADIKRLCRKVIVLNNGQIKYIGAPEQAILEYYSILEKTEELKRRSNSVVVEKAEELKSRTDNVMAEDISSVSDKESEVTNYIELRQIQCFYRDESNGKIQTNRVEFGKPFEIELEYKICAKVNRPEFRISFNTIENNMIVCSSSSRNHQQEDSIYQSEVLASFYFPNPLLYPREYFINAAICDQKSGYYYFSQVDAFRLFVSYPQQPVFADMEVGQGITHMEREFGITYGSSSR